ncbi:Ribokinase-like protein [Schizophyllum amplum]|uniref:Ribokinase n=1 Tax=Schizophyllum amplum TaxID=97359 RepID=A0A550CKQ5_9AGAR|nr:Ribokinase-like protein [Auriculariopsis ampla]
MPLCVVRGSINCDEYFKVKAIGRPGETISSFGYSKGIGGKGANQALAVARAAGTPKSDVHFIGAVGADGTWIKEQLRAWDINVEQVANTGDALPTGRAMIQVAEDGENAILLFPGANFDESHEMSVADAYFPAGTTHLLVQNEITMKSTLAALAAAKANSSAPVTTVFNPSPMPLPDQLKVFPWHQIDWLLINEGEGQELFALLQGSRHAGSVEALLQNLTALDFFAQTNIICTLGGDGLAACTLQNGTRAFTRLPAAKLQGDIRDTTGAGDTFTGYFVRGLMELEEAQVASEGEVLTAALNCAVQAAGMCVEKTGTVDSIPHRKDVEKRMHL